MPPPEDVGREWEEEDSVYDEVVERGDLAAALLACREAFWRTPAEENRVGEMMEEVRLALECL